jgi:hypothetical protein
LQPKSMNLPLEFDIAITELYPNGAEWDLVGVLSRSSKVYTLSHDSKILSSVFEILCEPIVKHIAEKHNMRVEKAAQNAYPEFTLIDDVNPNQKIAIDIKSTYRRYTSIGRLSPFKFTLGSYRSYLRNPTKSILYHYREYSEHWIIGFVYDRNENVRDIEIRDIIEAAGLQAPYSNIQYFVQEKYKIAGRTPGAGNTTNIGSISSANIEDFRLGISGFRTKDEFDSYWSNY